MILTVTLNAAVDSTWKIENYAIGSINRVKRGVPLRIAGGKGINVARVIKRLRGDVLATGFVGGNMGAFIEKKLDEEDITHEFIHVEGESRECWIIIDPINKTETVINGAGPEISPSEIEKFEDFFLKTIPICKVICLSGSLPLGMSTDIYADLITLANKENVPVILDTSNDALKEGILAKPFMVKPTIKEVEEILPVHNIESEGDIIKAAKYFSDKGVKVVVISRGEEGAILCTEKDSWEIIPPKVTVFNPVGSGDAFVGGCAVAIARGQSILDAVRWGTATGAANAEKLKAGDVAYDRVKELFKEVECDRL